MPKGESKSALVRMLEEEIERVRRESDEKIGQLKKGIASIFAFYYDLLGATLEFISSTTPRTRESVIAEYRFVRAFYKASMKLAHELADEETRSKMITSVKDVLKNVLKGASSVLSFDEMIDVLLRGLGKELTRELVPPDLIAELWGVNAYERFKKIISE